MKMNGSIALLLISGAGLLGACATQQEAPATAEEPIDPQALEEIRINAEPVALVAAPPESEVVCERVARTGSHLPTERCMTRSARRVETEEAQEWLRSNGQRGSLTEVR